MTNTISAGGVIYRKKQDQILILLIKDNWGQWTFPKGFCEEGESHEETAVREISEELGINAQKLKLEKTLGTIEYDYIWDGQEIHKQVYYFLFQWREDQAFALQKEEGIQDVCWIPVEQLLSKVGYKKDTAPLCQKIIAHFEEN